MVGTWTRRADFPDFAAPDEDDPSGQMGESGARAEHTLVYQEDVRAVRLFGGKARIVRGSRYHRPYNLRNYSLGSGAWDGTAWVQRAWSTIGQGPTNDPDEPILPGKFERRVELGRKAIAATYDPIRRRVITLGGLRQIYQRYHDGSAWDEDENDAYVESLPHLQYFDSLPDNLGRGFPSFSRDLLEKVGGHCGQGLLKRVFGAQLVHDTWRDRYVTFGGAYVVGEPSGNVDCSPRYNVETSEHTSRLLPQGATHREWDPRKPGAPDRYFITQLPSFSGGFEGLPNPPASRIRHTMVFDEHRGVTVLVGGWDGFNLTPSGMPSETWEYGPATDATGFLVEPPVLTELCLGDTLTLEAPARNPTGPGNYPRNQFSWYHGPRVLPDATNSTLAIPAVDASHAGEYLCRLIDRCGNVFETRPATVRVGGPPVITTPPVSVHVCPGETASARFFFTSDYPATVQWFRLAPDRTGNAGLAALAAVPGAESNELAFDPMSPADSGFFRARVTNRCGTAWTPTILMTAGVWLRLEPDPATNEVCAAGSFAVRATGKGPLTYQWRRNGEPLPSSARVSGTETPTLAFAAIHYLDDAAYDCLVRDACHTVTTRVATLTVLPNPPFVLSDTRGPSARQRHRLAYDSRRAVTVLFGGLGDGVLPASLYPNDTWEYDGTNWAVRTTSSAPSGRLDFGLAFDRHRARTVLFGGRTLVPFDGLVPNGETWEYDGTNWLQRFPAHAPEPRSGHALFYDPVRRVTTLYGGDTTLPNPRAGDLWTWDGTDWTRVEITGDRPQFGPYGSPPRSQMVWDDRRGYAVLPPTSLNQGGANDYATWTWDGVAWTRRPYAFTGFGNAPAMAGLGLGLAYDSYRGEVIYWGGSGNDQARLWRWNGRDWRRDDIEELVGFQLEAAAAYDERRHTVVWFGGNYGGSDPALRGLSRRTFERVLADEPVLLRQPAVLDEPAATRLTVRVVAAGAPPLAYRWQRDGVPLTEGFPYSGTTNASLVVDRVLAADPAWYRCVVSGRCGETVSRGTTLAGITELPPLQLGLATAPVEGRPGLSLSWSGPGVVLEQAPAPSGPWTPVVGATSPYLPRLTGPGGFFRLRGP